MEVYYGVYDFERSKRKMGNYTPKNKLFMFGWAYSRRSKNVYTLADTERRGEASGRQDKAREGFET